jgi:AraC-like DNA-binding protein
MHSYLIPPTCKERFLTDTRKGVDALRQHHLRYGGLSTLYGPYSIRRFPSKEPVLLITTAGGGNLDIDGKNHLLTKNSLCVLPAGSTYHYWARKSWGLCWLHLSPTPRWLGMANQFVLRDFPEWKPLETLMRLFLTELTRCTGDSVLLLSSYARSIALLVERELTGSESPCMIENRSRIEALRRSLSQEPEQSWSVPLLAAESGFSARHLQNLVSTLYGCGVMEMVAGIRMEKAASFLLSTNWKVEEIATRVGYQNSFAFSRAFKRHMKLSPGYFRKAAAV